MNAHHSFNTASRPNFSPGGSRLCLPPRRCIAVVCSLALWFNFAARAIEDTWNYAVQISATIQTSPPQVVLHWLQDTVATPASYTLFRKAPDASSWGPGTSLPGTVTNYVDATVAAGQIYEYQIVKTAAGYSGYGYICVGLNAPLIEDRGKLVLVVDNTCAASLTTELARLESDLAGDGWQVLRHNVNRDEKPAGIKILIQADYAADPARVKAVFLFGHIPVVRSGNLNVDGHLARPMPADAFYGDMDGTWTDVNNDGIYDQSYLPSDVELEVGRVDFANMPGRLTAGGPPTFPGEIDLLRRYLQKNHSFRHGLLNVPRRALVGDAFGVFRGQAFAASGYRNFAPFFDAGGIVLANTSTNAPTEQKWISMLGAASYLWAYGCGAGSYTSMSELGTHANYDEVWSTDIVNADARAVFMMMFGSWLADWDSTDNIMRASLATPTCGLTCSWAGRPHHYFHHMGVGETVGYSMRLSQNNAGQYQNQVNRFLRGIHISLLGDPTLRLHPVSPPSALTTTTNLSGGISLRWRPAAEVVLGYHVYRAPGAGGNFTRLTSSPVGGTNFFDASVFSGPCTYMVRAVKFETSPSGTYLNPSQGIFAAAIGTAPDLPVVTVIATDDLAARTNFDAGTFTITRTGSPASTLAVNCALSGSATNGTDYHLLATAVSIPAGQASAAITLIPMASTTLVGTRVAVLTLITNAAYTVGQTNSATIIISGNAVPVSAITQDSGVISLTWTSSAGKVYRVASKNNLVAPDWMNLGGSIPASLASTSWTDDTNGAPRQRFYLVYLTN